MNHKQHIQSLFQAAKHESPKLSFEQASMNFQASLPTSLLGTAKFWLQHISLNHWLLLASGIVLLSAALILLPEREQANTVLAVELDDSDTTYKRSNSFDQLETSLPDTLPTPGPDHESTKLSIQSKDAPKSSKAPSASTGKKIIKPIQEEKRLIESEVGKDSNHVSDASLIIAEVEDSTQTPARLHQQTSDSIKQTNANLSSTKTSKDTASPNPNIRLAPLILKLNRSDNKNTFQGFIQVLENSGLTIQAESQFLEGDSLLHHFTCKFKHKKGLKFDLSGTGFQTFELHLQTDHLGQVQNFKYRFNSDTFTKEIPLKLKGYKSYEFGEGYSGKSGRTNIQIENIQN